MQDLVNYYQILGVSEKATFQEIKKAYHQKALQFHPDKNSGDEQAERKFKECNQAYQVLSKVEERAKYDLYLKRFQPKAAEEEAQRRAAAEEESRKQRYAAAEHARQQQTAAFSGGNRNQQSRPRNKQSFPSGNQKHTSDEERMKKFFEEQAEFRKRSAEQQAKWQADIRRQAEAEALKQRAAAAERARQQQARAAEEYRRKQEEEAAQRREYIQKVNQETTKISNQLTSIRRDRIEKIFAITQRIDNLSRKSVHVTIDLDGLKKIYNDEIKSYENLGTYIKNNGFGPEYKKLYDKALSASKDRNDAIQQVEQLIHKVEIKVIKQQQQDMISINEINKIQHRIDELTAEKSQSLYQIKKPLNSPSGRSFLSKISDEIEQAYQAEIASLQALQQHIKTYGFDNSDRKYRELLSNKQHNTFFRSKKILELQALINTLPQGSLAYGWRFGQQPINPTSSSSPPGNPPSSSAGKPPSSNLHKEHRKFEVNDSNLKATPQSYRINLSTFEKIWRRLNKQQQQTPDKSRSSTKWGDNPQGTTKSTPLQNTINREHPIAKNPNHYRKPGSV